MRALLFLGAVAVTLAGVATADTGAWQELLTGECFHTSSVHFVPPCSLGASGVGCCGGQRIQWAPSRPTSMPAGVDAGGVGVEACVNVSGSLGFFLWGS